MRQPTLQYGPSLRLALVSLPVQLLPFALSFKLSSPERNYGEALQLTANLQGTGIQGQELDQGD